MPPSGLRDSCESSDSDSTSDKWVPRELTSSVSCAAMRWMGMRKSRNRRVRAAKPFAARVCTSLSKERMFERRVATYYHTVVPSKDSKLVQAGDEVPASGDVSSKEDAKGED
jgi:hypothetical protein